MDQAITLLEEGGPPLQQATASMLARAGRYVRREQGYSGVEFEFRRVEFDDAAWNWIAGTFAEMHEFSTQVQDLAKNIKASDGGPARYQPFYGRVHHLLNILSLAAKVQPMVDAALAIQKAGRKPVITVANTNEAFLERATGLIGPGRPAPITMADFVLENLERLTHGRRGGEPVPIPPGRRGRGAPGAAQGGRSAARTG